MSEVRIADQKARLSEHLRSVRQGETVTVRDSPDLSCWRRRRNTSIGAKRQKITASRMSRERCDNVCEKAWLRLVLSRIA